MGWWDFRAHKPLKLGTTAGLGVLNGRSLTGQEPDFGLAVTVDGWSDAAAQVQIGGRRGG